MARFQARAIAKAVYRSKVAVLPDALRDALAEQVKKTADEMGASMKRSIPLGPDVHGHLRDTIETKEGETVLHAEVTMGDQERPYAAIYEFGDGQNRKPHPTMFKAKRRARFALKKRVALTLKEVFARNALTP